MLTVICSPAYSHDGSAWYCTPVKIRVDEKQAEETAHEQTFIFP